MNGGRDDIGQIQWLQIDGCRQRRTTMDKKATETVVDKWETLVVKDENIMDKNTTVAGDGGYAKRR